MDERFVRCIKEGKLVKVGVQPDMVKKELDVSNSDLKSAEDSISTGNFKWAIVQAYYSMFHTAKALVLSSGYREKSHACLSIALRVLFVDSGILENKHSDHFKDCMDLLREDADYGMIYSEQSALKAVEWAAEFLKDAKKVINA